MRNWVKHVALGVLALMLLVGCSTEPPGSDSSEESGGSSGEGEKTIGFSVSTLNNPFFVTLNEGMEKAAESEGVKVQTKDAQDDPSKQVSDIEDMIQQKVDVLLVNPTDSAAIVSAIESANDAGIPVITVDRQADGGDIAAHIASDNVKGGEMAANHILEKIESEGKVVELQGIPGSSAARERGEGFHNIVDEESGIEVVASQPADFDRSKGLTVMENIIQGNPKIDAVFAHNDQMALGAIEALEAAGMNEDVVVVGFDAIDDAKAAIEEGRMGATVAQQPDKIGEKGIETALSVLNGEDVEEFIPVELQLVTGE
ncbi:ribose ABC transporter substrate-binding protein RbsB [Halobacillus sp. MO56]